MKAWLSQAIDHNLLPTETETLEIEWQNLLTVTVFVTCRYSYVQHNPNKHTPCCMNGHWETKLDGRVGLCDRLRSMLWWGMYIFFEEDAFLIFFLYIEPHSSGVLSLLAIINVCCLWDAIIHVNLKIVQSNCLSGSKYANLFRFTFPHLFNETQWKRHVYVF